MTREWRFLYQAAAAEQRPNENKNFEVIMAYDKIGLLSSNTWFEKKLRFVVLSLIKSSFLKKIST